MNARNWLRETDPLQLLANRYPMRGHDSTQPQARQSRLYLLACARRQWARLPAVCRAVVWLGEVYADAPRDHREMYEAVTPITEQMMGCDGTPDDVRSAELALGAVASIAPAYESARAAAGDAPLGPLAPDDWRGVTRLLYLAFEPLTPPYRWVPSPLYDLALLRDVYGNPYRRTPFDSEWRTGTVMALAEQMYDAREFTPMPILADALQDAGCDNPDILEHCRGGGPHARGCWVLDLILEK